MLFGLFRQTDDSAIKEWRRTRKRHKHLYYLHNNTFCSIISHFLLSTTEKDHFLEEDTTASRGPALPGRFPPRLRAWVVVRGASRARVAGASPLRRSVHEAYDYTIT